MRRTVRLRFVALDLVEGWIELRRMPAWSLVHAERKRKLRISMFPVGEGVVIDLPTLLHIERERRTSFSAQLRPSTLLNETSWTDGARFCVVSHTRLGPSHWPHLAHTSYVAEWAISDGRYMLESTTEALDIETFRESVVDCEAMMRTVRFEGPS